MPTSPLQGPPFALPRRLDRLADRWARLPPRLRLLVVVLLIVLFGGVQAARLAGAQARWGGPGAPVWQATATTAAGHDAAAAVQRVRLPRAAVPPNAVVGPLPPNTVLALPLVDGAILTDIHLSPSGPAVGLAPDERLLPIPVERSWGIEAGGVVDVWAIIDGREDTTPLATARPVLLLRDDGPRPVALVSLHQDSVAEATATLARGRLLLTLRG
ncbi:MAG TPA: hypothetical protein VMM13_06760 [Euzebya sp.]|nr:hypothetical protein [Euzebya sp.]